MADRDVQMVGIIVGDRLPVERPRAERHAADRLQLLEAVDGNLIRVRRHHLRDRRRTGLQRHEEEPAPIFQSNWKQAMILSPEARILVPVRHSDQPPVARVAPRMIRAGQDLGAAARAIDQPRSPVATDVGEGPRLPVVSADDDHALAKIFDRTPVAWLRDLILMAHNLRSGAQESLLLGLEEFRVEIEPAGEAHVVERVVFRRNSAQLRRHGHHLPRRAGAVQPSGYSSVVRRELRLDDGAGGKLAVANTAARPSPARPPPAEVAAHDPAGPLEVGEHLAAILGDRVHRRAPRTPAAPTIAPRTTAEAAAPTPARTPAVPQRII